MSQPDPDSPESAEEFANSGEDQLLRALAAAPRPDARTVLARALPGLPELADTVDAGGGAAPQPGEVIEGRYRIEHELGSGGMGIVFAATQLATGRRVALKWMRARGRLREDRERDQAYRRFVREAQVAGRIRHPNVVDVLDAGVDPAAPYLVMELLEGETLRARMEARGPMAWDEALQLILPVMSGVGAAHAQGVIHRDLKPDNVFLARDGAGREVPKVLDFGISRLHGTEGGGEPSLTRTGTMIGTPAYMPLEQLRGSGETDERTDVYALGVVLYEMLAGQRPYSARNAADFAVLIASDAITPLSRHRPDLTGVREAAVMRALSREPAARFASVQVLADALAAPVGERRWRMPIWISLAVALSLGAASLAARWGRPEPMANELAPPSTASSGESPAASAPAARPPRASEPAAAVPSQSAPPSISPSEAPSRALDPAPAAARRARKPGIRRAEPDFAVPTDARGELPPSAPGATPALDLAREQF